jgi:type I restriction enzyme M protein
VATLALESRFDLAYDAAHALSFAALRWHGYRSGNRYIVWIYDLRTNQHFMLKTNPLRREHLDEFVQLFHAANRQDRRATWSEQTPEGRWRCWDFAELVARYKASLDIFWLKDEALADSADLPAPEVIAQEIVDDLEAALEQFRLIAGDLASA